MSKKENKKNQNKQTDMVNYDKKLKDDIQTLKILRVILIVSLLTSSIIIALAVVTKQYTFAIIWSVCVLILLIFITAEWIMISKRKEKYHAILNKSEIKTK